DHPISHGALCALGQASVMELYSPLRLKAPRIGGQDSGWETVDGELAQAFSTLRRGGKPLRLLTNTLISPSLQRQVDLFLRSFPGSRQVVYDALSCSAILKAHAQTHGR